ncbi:MAG: HupE/UreJ family protein [Methylobacter sp.]|jgi:urease accessory protein
MRIKNWLITALCLVSPSLYAHTGGLVEASLMTGLLHPLTGIDHLLVLMAVGLIAAKQGGRALVAFPFTFLALMAAGALLNVYAIQLPFVEPLITVSIIAFGLLVSVNQKQRSKILFMAVSFFAVFHGYAHAAEIPADSSATLYFSALMLMSLAICLGSSVVGLYTGKRVHYLFSLACLSSGLYYLAAG